MDRNTFLERTGISKNTLTNYIQAGIVNPTKKNGRTYDFSEEDVETVAAVKNGKNPQTATPQEVPNPAQPPKENFDLNCYGESVEPGTGVFNRRSFLQAYIPIGLDPDTVTDTAEFFNDILLDAVGVKTATFKNNMKVVSNNPDTKYFDKYLKLTPNKDKAVYSLNEVKEKFSDQIAKLEYPDFESLYTTAYRVAYSNVYDNKCIKNIEAYIEWNPTVNTIFDDVSPYISKVHKTYPPVFHKPYKPCHSKVNIPKLMDSNNNPVYPDEIEDLRYINGRNVLNYPDDPELTPGWRAKFISMDGTQLRLSDEEEAEYQRLNAKEMNHDRMKRKFYNYYEIINRPKGY